MFIKKYASHVARIAGLDLSEEMVKMARSINRELIESGKAEFKQGNASSLPWGDGEFSVVVGIETFYFMQKPMESLMEIYRVLSPGGRLVLEMGFNKEDGLDHTEYVEKTNLTLYSADEMTELLQESGFSEIEFTYYKGFWLPFKGHVVQKGMIVKAAKE